MDGVLGTTPGPVYVKLTKVTLIGSKDIQKSQIPGNLVMGTNSPKKASALISMAPPA